MVVKFYGLSLGFGVAVICGRSTVLFRRAVALA